MINLDEEQIHHLIDLLQMNITDKLMKSHKDFDQKILTDSIYFDKEIIIKLKDTLSEKI